ncbi:putative amidoligase enzyme-domain-containing protein [Daldinia eschscholtzii]|nr:putative amidoligase enzyme-domain-containing protein [Daldinia eschscholtzii]
MSVNQTLPRARPRTFGVELEFIILWLWDDDPDPYQDEAGELAPILRIPRDHTTTLTYTDIEMIIYDMICDVLNSHGLPAQPWQRTPEYSSWVVKPDPSIMLTREKANWYGVELTSPAEHASPDAFRAISYALDLISSTYRIMVNDTCGFHVHVGDGKETMPLEHVRRVASLLWAADPIIAALHPPERRTNPFSRSIREYSPLARGRKVADVLSQADHGEEHTCIRYIGRSHRHGEQPISLTTRIHPQ